MFSFCSYYGRGPLGSPGCRLAPYGPLRLGKREDHEDGPHLQPAGFADYANDLVRGVSAGDLHIVIPDFGEISARPTTK